MQSKIVKRGKNWGVGALALWSVVACAGSGAKSDTPEEDPRFVLNENLTPIIDATPADLSAAEEDALIKLFELAGDQMININYRSEAEFLPIVNMFESILISAKKRVEIEEGLSGNFNAVEGFSCLSYQDTEANWVSGRVFPSSSVAINYNKKQELNDYEQTLDAVDLKVAGGWNVDYENCRDLDYEVETAMMGGNRVSEWEVENNLRREVRSKYGLSGLFWLPDAALELRSQRDTIYNEREQFLQEYNGEKSIFDTDEYKNFQASIDEIEGEINRLREIYEQAEKEIKERLPEAQREFERLEFLRELEIAKRSHRRDGRLSGESFAIVTGKALFENRKEFDRMMVPEWDEADTRLAESIEGVKGQIIAQSSLNGMVESRGFDSESKKMINFKIAFTDLTVALNLGVEDFYAMLDNQHNILLPFSERQKDIEDILANAISCSGSISLGADRELSCGSVLQYFLKSIIYEKEES